MPRSGAVCFPSLFSPLLWSRVFRPERRASRSSATAPRCWSSPTRPTSSASASVCAKRTHSPPPATASPPSRSPKAGAPRKRSREAATSLPSSRMIVTVAPQGGKWKPTGTAADIAQFFNGSTPGVGLSIKTARRNAAAPDAGLADVRPQSQGRQRRHPLRPPPHRSRTSSRWAPPSPRRMTSTTTASARIRRAILDRRGHSVRCAHDYNAPAGQSVCVPFVVTNKGYGLLWDNPSRTTVDFGFNNSTSLDLRRRPARLLLRHRRQDLRRDLLRLSSAHRRHAHAAKVRLRLHPVQAALHQPGRADGRRQGLSRPPSTPSTTSSSTGSTTPRWARWTWTPPSGPTPSR